MPRFPTLPTVDTYRVVTDAFRGLDRNARTEDGTFVDMANMSGDDYPVLSTRKARTVAAHISSPQGILAKDALAYVDGPNLIYNGNIVEGVTMSVLPSMCPKKLLSMGAYILIWPDKIYVNTADLSDYGYIEQKNSYSGSITYSLAKNDGTIYDTPTVSPTAPADPQNGDLWIDSSGEVHGLFQWDSQSGQWVNIATTYIRIDATGIGAGLSRHDGIELSGCDYTGGDPAIAAQIQALNGTVIVYDCGDDWITVVGIVDQAVTEASGAVSAERNVPDMDYVTEAQNRIWGCKYGLVDGQTVNEIRCCALGDFRNWYQFLGLSTDSWVGSQGTDGQFTGAITHLGYPLFFKETCLHKVYISSQGAHQVVTATCRGVQKGSDRSLAIVDELLYYKARIGIMRYDGSLPVCVSDVLGTEYYYEAVGGGFGSKYYVSMKTDADVWHLYVYDARTGFWHRQDSLHVMGFAAMDDSLFAINAESEDNYHALLDLNGMIDTYPDETDTQMDWSATTGIIGLEYPDQKRLSRFVIRMDLPVGSSCAVRAQYDSNGTWVEVAAGVGRGLGTLTIPVIPRRCDHMQISISGTGPAKIYSFSKILEISGDKQ